MAKDDRKMDAAAKLLQEGVGKMGSNVIPFIDSEGKKQIEISNAPKKKVKKDIKMDPNMMHNIMEYFDKAHSLDGSQSLTDDGNAWERPEAEDDHDAYEDGWDASFVPEPENFREGPVGFLDPQEHLEMLKADDKEGKMYRDAVINSFEQEISSYQTMLDTYKEDDDMDGAKQYFRNGIEGMVAEIDYILNIEKVMKIREDLKQVFE